MSTESSAPTPVVDSSPLGSPLLKTLMAVVTLASVSIPFAQRVVEVLWPPAPPRIEGFSASTTEISAGESVRLHWDIKGADAVTIRPDVYRGNAGQGELLVSPRTTTDYSLEAKSKAGMTAFGRVTITVHAPITAAAPSLLPASKPEAMPVANLVRSVPGARLALVGIDVINDGSIGDTDWRFEVLQDTLLLVSVPTRDYSDKPQRNRVSLPPHVFELRPGRTRPLELRAYRGRAAKPSITVQWTPSGQSIRTGENVAVNAADGRGRFVLRFAPGSADRLARMQP